MRIIGLMMCALTRLHIGASIAILGWLTGAVASTDANEPPKATSFPAHRIHVSSALEPLRFIEGARR